MQFRDRLSALLVLAVFGTLGGMIAGWVRTPDSAEAAPRKPKVITAQEFRLTDLKGKRRGSFVLGSTGQPRLDLYGTDGKVRTSVFLSEEGEHPVVALSDVYANASPQLQTRIVLGTQDAGSPRIYVTDTNLVIRADLGVIDLRPDVETSGGFLKLYDTDGKDQASLHAQGDGASEFAFSDNNPLTPFPESRVRIFRDLDGNAGVEVRSDTSLLQPDPTSARLAAGLAAGPRLDLYDPSQASQVAGAFHIAFGYPAGLLDGSWTIPPGADLRTPGAYWFIADPMFDKQDAVIRSGAGPGGYGPFDDDVLLGTRPPR